MRGSPKIEDIAGDLHTMFVKLASVCLKEKPSDVERHCLEWLAKRHGMKLENTIALTRGHSVALDDDISEFVNDIETAQQASSTFASTAHKTPAFGYASSGEGEVQTVASFHSHSDTGEAGNSEHVKATSVEEHSQDGDSDHNECYLFSTDGIAADELEWETNNYANDSRMQSLFRAWDKDGSGAVDFVELVIALHKFERVAAAGIDIHVASEALVQFVESDTERELNLREFAKVIILFAHNNFQTSFEEVADHMLAVATGTSEEAVLMAANGEDVSELEAADKEEEEFLRLTAKGMADDISRNIRRIRTKRVMFSKGGSRS